MPAASAARLLRLREGGSGRRARGLGREVGRQAAIGARRVTCAARRGVERSGTQRVRSPAGPRLRRGGGRPLQALTSAEVSGGPAPHRTGLKRASFLTGNLSQADFPGPAPAPAVQPH